MVRLSRGVNIAGRDIRDGAVRKALQSPLSTGKESRV